MAGKEHICKKVSKGVTVECKYWKAATPNKTLLINSHGYQHQTEPVLKTSVPLAHKNFAYTVPNGFGMMNDGFSNEQGGENELAAVVKKYTSPPLKGYQSLIPNARCGGFDDAMWDVVFDKFQKLDVCDVLNLAWGADENQTPDAQGTCSLLDLLAADHWSSGTNILSTYTDFLLIMCRTPFDKIGMGGAPKARPSGLYNPTDTTVTKF
ncbi:MAG: hypothetical protein N2C14_05355 [Planctomycetales bacterium]